MTEERDNELKGEGVRDAREGRFAPRTLLSDACESCTGKHWECTQAAKAKTLRDLPIGWSATIASVGGEGSLRQHLLDMGVIPHARVEVVKFAPMGDPMQVRIHGYELTLRLADAEKISLVDICCPTSDMFNSEVHHGPSSVDSSASYPHPHERPHPGLGEDGRFHDSSSENPLPEGRALTFGLVGNQNCGKTTLFNQLTGSNQHVGNFPGVTVDRKEGVIRKHEDTLVTDLPGIYSLSPYSSEEIVTRQFLLEDRPCGIINIVDATNIERNLYLTMQLLELDMPMVLALNMMDEVVENGGSILVNELEQQLGIPVVPISAIKDEGVDELVAHAVHVARYQERPLRQDFCDSQGEVAALHRCMHAIMHLIEDHAERAGLPRRFAASKVIEGDELVIDKLDLTQNELETIEHLVLEAEQECGLDRAAAMANMRYSFINRVCAATVVKPQVSREHARSEKIDRILTGRITAIPVFVAIMAVVFFLTFNVIGAFFQDLLDMGITALGKVCAQALERAGADEAIQSLVVDGIFGGVGSVLSFLPIIVTLFFFLSLLEDSGYMARVAFFMDKLLRKIGLSGRSIVPMLIGFGCSVPSIMASRTLPSARDRKLTIMMTPFMSCSAKLPIYAFLTAAFFPDCAALVMTGLYFLGIVIGVLVALLAKNTVFAGEAVPFVMELPNYRFPGPRNVAHLLWDKAKDFLQRAFTIIFVATIVIWLLQSFTPSLAFTTDSADSILSVIAGVISPLFAPIGLGDWRVVTALISGFIAKESVVSTLGVLFGEVSEIALALTPVAGASLLVFCLLYTPCVAAIASVKRELGGKWALGVIALQCGIAYIAAFVVRALGVLVGAA